MRQYCFLTWPSGFSALTERSQEPPLAVIVLSQDARLHSISLLSVQGAKLWISLPTDLKFEININVFNKGLKMVDSFILSKTFMLSHGHSRHQLPTGQQGVVHKNFRENVFPIIRSECAISISIEASEPNNLKFRIKYSSVPQ